MEMTLSIEIVLEDLLRAGHYTELFFFLHITSYNPHHHSWGRYC